MTVQITHTPSEDGRQRKKAKAATAPGNEDKVSGLADGPPGGPPVRKGNDRTEAPAEANGGGQAADSGKASSAELDVVT